MRRRLQKLLWVYLQASKILYIIPTIEKKFTGYITIFPFSSRRERERHYRVEHGLPLKHYIKVFERDHRRRYYTNDPFLLTSFYEHRIRIYMHMYVLRVSPRILRFSIPHYQVRRISNHIVSGLIMPTNLHNNTII